MKKLLIITAAIFGILAITTLIIDPVFALSATNNNNGGMSIPESVMKIAGKSCVKCHTVPGNKMALSKLNLTNWDKLSDENQAGRAKKMCDMVTKDKMPPNKFRKSNPNDVPSKEEIKIICDWAQSLQVNKK
jgi:hypothetical protein